MIEQPTRRGLITGLGALFIAAPAIVRASSLMPVKAIADFDLVEIGWSEVYGREAWVLPSLFSRLDGTNKLLSRIYEKDIVWR